MARRCGACSDYQHPPRTDCLACGSTELAFVPVSGRGVVYSHTVVHDTRVQGLKPYQPFGVVAVQLDESPNLIMVSDVISFDGLPAIGDAVQVVFEELARGRAVPQFRRRRP